MFNQRVTSYTKDGLPSAQTNPKRGKAKKRGWSWWQKLLLFSGTLFFLGVLAVAIVWFIYVAPLIKDLPSPDNLTANNERYGVSSQIFDRNGVKLYEIFSGERRVPISLEGVPAYVAQASISIEDKNFYNHMGISLTGIARAFLANRESGGYAQGGSTITQQLVKKAYLTSEKSYERKIKEIFLSMWVETVYSKDEILEMYLNYIPYGGTSVGIGAAAESYFDKTADQLSLAEAALLAGLPQAPSRYSPFTNSTEAAKNRQAEVLRRMVEDGYIVQEQADLALQEELHFALKKTDIKAPHFVFYVRDYLVAKYGEEMVEKGGLRVMTTLDLEIQDTAQASLSAEIAKLGRQKVGNGAALVTVPDTGEILAMIGSKDYFDATHDGQVNVTIASRQPGSSIKPLVYATAMEQKLLNPSSILLDVSTCFTSKYSEPYCPKNYSGGFSGPVTVRESLGSSLNIPAVKTMKMIGVESFIRQANKMGVKSLGSAKDYGLSLSLGGGEVKATEMAEAFGVLANDGVKVPLIPILDVTDYTGKVLEKYDPLERSAVVAALNETEDSDSDFQGIERVMKRAPAYMTADIMRDNKARMLGFGGSSELVIKGDKENGPKQVSVKTGTTNNVRDNWTIGFSPKYLVTVWVGNNNNTPMNQNLVSGVTGAAPIWNNIMSWLLRDEAVINWPEMPGEVQKGKVCTTGMPKMYGMECSENKEDIYWTASRPSRSETRTEQIWIDKRTGAPPAPGVEDELELQERVIYNDPLTEFYCGDCVRIPNEEGKTEYEKFDVSDESGIKMIGD